MAWMFVDTQVHNIFAAIGAQQANVYRLNEDCIIILEDIFSKLLLEDRTQYSFRRIIGAGHYIRKYLLPLLLNTKDSIRNEKPSKIIDITIKILVNLTTPTECLLPAEVWSKVDSGCSFLIEINQLLNTTKHLFVETCLVKVIVDHMKFLIKRRNRYDFKQCESINDCLLLLRNVLHIPENRKPNMVQHIGVQNKILWNLFANNIDKIVLHLITIPQKVYWAVTIVQLIALLYKDQHVSTLQKLLKIWYETSVSESSDDNESNTSPPNQCSNDSSPVLTSDSSDNGITSSKEANNYNNEMAMTHKQHAVKSLQNRNKIFVSSLKHTFRRPSDADSSSSTQTTDSKSTSSLGTETTISVKKDFQSSCLELSDYGYGTQIEHQETISATSSNEDDISEQKLTLLQKSQKIRYKYDKNRNIVTTVVQEKKNRGRNKLMKRNKINIKTMKGLLYHLPTDDVISNILKEFTVDFLLKGFGSLVEELHTQLLQNYQILIDTSHFFWLITYFLKFATQLELDFVYVKPVLSFHIISYLTYEGVNTFEQFELSYKRMDNETNLKSYLRRMHLVVTAIKEFLEAIQTYNKQSVNLTPDDHCYLKQLQHQLVAAGNLRCLILFLIRHYNPQVQSKQYLQDLITTNHVMLLLLDENWKTTKLDYVNCMLSHLTQYANEDVIRHYGILLENYETNGKYVNDCIFTMLHHVGGDLNQVTLLLQPHILKTFSRIWEANYSICDDWTDLIKYVIHKFVNVPKHTEEEISSTNLNDLTEGALIEKANWSTKSTDELHNYYINSIECDNLVKNIERLYIENGVTNKTRTQIIDGMLHQNIITQNHYEQLMRIETERNNMQFHYDIQLLKEQLIRKNHTDSLIWLQQILLDACQCKIALTNNEKKMESHLREPVSYCYVQLNQAIPIVPWTEQQINILKNHTFVLLLQKLGFHLPNDTRKLFVRIPNFWTADYLYTIVQELGPINSTQVKFDTNLLKTSKGSEELMYNTVPVLNIHHFEQSRMDVPVLNIQCVHSTLANKSGVKEDENIFLNKNPDEFSEVGAAFDLTQMYVSDEEDK